MTLTLHINEPHQLKAVENNHNLQKQTAGEHTSCWALFESTSSGKLLETVIREGKLVGNIHLSLNVLIDATLESM